MPFTSRRQALATVAGSLLPAWAHHSAHAQTAWPNKPVRIVVPYAPGGANDILARVVAEKLGPLLGAQIVIVSSVSATPTTYPKAVIC